MTLLSEKLHVIRYRLKNGCIPMVTIIVTMILKATRDFYKIVGDPYCLDISQWYLILIRIHLC